MINEKEATAEEEVSPWAKTTFHNPEVLRTEIRDFGLEDDVYDA